MYALSACVPLRTSLVLCKKSILNWCDWLFIGSRVLLLEEVVGFFYVLGRNELEEFRNYECLYFNKTVIFLEH